MTPSTPIRASARIAFVLVAAACAHTSGTGADREAEAVRAADAALQQAIEAQDLERTVSFYADDALLLPAAAPLIRGKAAIRDEYSHIFAIPDFESTGTLTRLEVSRGADLACRGRDVQHGHSAARPQVTASFARLFDHSIVRPDATRAEVARFAETAARPCEWIAQSGATRFGSTRTGQLVQAFSGPVAGGARAL